MAGLLLEMVQLALEGGNVISELLKKDLEQQPSNQDLVMSCLIFLDANIPSEGSPFGAVRFCEKEEPTPRPHPASVNLFRLRARQLNPIVLQVVQRRLRDLGRAK